MEFLGFGIEAEYEGMIGWTNGKNAIWIGAADATGKKHKHRTGNVGLHHYAFRLRSRKDVDALQAFYKRGAPRSSILPANITTTTMRCSSSTPTA